MKIIPTIAILSLFIMTFSDELKAQSNWELGGRFGDEFAIDLTIPLSKSPRFHGALYFDHDLAAGGYFDWMFALEGGPTGLKFYPGVGPELYFGNKLNVAAAGDFGMEYSFDFPLTIGLDWRPHFMLSNDMRYYGGNWGFIARFRFGNGTKFVKTN